MCFYSLFRRRNEFKKNNYILFLLFLIFQSLVIFPTPFTSLSPSFLKSQSVAIKQIVHMHSYPKHIMLNSQTLFEFLKACYQLQRHTKN